MIEQQFNRFPLAHTFSIVARDAAIGCLGVAVQSHWFSVGSLVTWAEAGVGAVATQANAEISYGPLGLELMRAGKSAGDALTSLLAGDELRALRQVAMVDAAGRVAAHTGERCLNAAGHQIGEGYAVQANMMVDSGVWPAMADAYESSQGDLAERLLAALEAGQAAGGDIRGQQSAAILVVSATSTGRPWVDRQMELRVEDHPEPLKELRRLLLLHRAYQLMNQGDEHLGRGKVDEAFAAYQEAARLAPEVDELPFWEAVSLVNIGRLEEALPIFRRVFSRNHGWAVLVQRLTSAGMLSADAETMRRILEQSH
ncbi:MAG: DUF1028 domain-containing protein [Anaerolineaceae bacterium]|jgi:uncharacterized Ntn-hydrolase superfamily protein